MRTPIPMNTTHNSHTESCLSDRLAWSFILRLSVLADLACAYICWHARLSAILAIAANRATSRAQCGVVRCEGLRGLQLYSATLALRWRRDQKDGACARTLVVWGAICTCCRSVT